MKVAKMVLSSILALLCFVYGAGAMFGAIERAQNGEWFWCVVVALSSLIAFLYAGAVLRCLIWKESAGRASLLAAGWAKR